jgi:dipeptidase
MREWRALSLAAPSLNLPAPAASGDTRYPFSVPADNPLSAQDVMAIHRDFYPGTPHGITQNPALFYQRSGQSRQSLMASPFGPSDLDTLLGIPAEGSIVTSSSVSSYVSRVNAGLPDPIKRCMRLGLGPGESTCFVPVYSGTTELPKAWENTELAMVSRDNAWWAFTIADKLPLIQWQNAIVSVEGASGPAEETFFAQQFDFENAVLDLYSGRSKVAADELAAKLATNYTNACMNAVADGYWKLIDYLLFRYYYGSSAQALAAIDVPAIALIPGQGVYQ